MNKMLFSTKFEGIGGKIKQRYADFIVEELSKWHKCKVEFFSEERRKKLKINKKLYEKKPKGKEYLILEMEKVNLETAMAIKKLSRGLQISRKRIGFAGMKDKRAITSQLISIWDPPLERLREFKERSIFLKPVMYSSQRIELGDLWRNRFIVTIRDIKLNRKELKKRWQKAEKELKKGIANYFGLQRFGGARQISHKVGKELLKNNFEKAVWILLAESSEIEKEKVRAAREKLAKEKDFRKALGYFPKECNIELAILNYLVKNENDFIGALRVLPKHILYLFTHAYQSYLFNKILDKRISTIGLEAVEGDILQGEIPTAALFGYNVKLAKGIPGKIEREVLQEENIKLEDFHNKKMPEISSKGSRRAIKIIPHNLKLLEISKDELNEGKLKIKIEFELDKGCYATILLREITKCEI